MRKELAIHQTEWSNIKTTSISSLVMKQFVADDGYSWIMWHSAGWSFVFSYFYSSVFKNVATRFKETMMYACMWFGRDWDPPNQSSWREWQKQEHPQDSQLGNMKELRHKQESVMIYPRINRQLISVCFIHIKCVFPKRFVGLFWTSYKRHENSACARHYNAVWFLPHCLFLSHPTLDTVNFCKYFKFRNSYVLLLQNKSRNQLAVRDGWTFVLT
jgi:hypothetical protein